MPTSTITVSTRGTKGGRGQDCRGFTLIEVGLVIVLVGIVFGMVVPRFQDRSHADLVSHIRRLAVTFRFLRHQAILNGRTYRLVFDISTQRYCSSEVDESGGEATFARCTGAFVHEVALPEPVVFSDVVFPLTAGKLYEGLGYTDFYPDGYVDLTVIHLDNGDQAYTLRVEPLTGNVYVTAGYQDFDFSA